MTMEPFDLMHVSLSGTKLIEASAGTGKTYTIAGLVVRLLIELKFTVEQILVVTYTKAATEELKDRIRRRIIQARDGFSNGKCDDVLVEQIIDKYDDHEQAVQLLNDAIVDFDKASIFTIHGFCQRILHENAFETGKLYETELVPDPTELLQEVADDFWRIYFYGAAPEFIRFLLYEKKINDPSYFWRMYHGASGLELKIIPDFEKPEMSSLNRYRKVFRQLSDQWQQSRMEVANLLMEPALKANQYGSFRPDRCKPDLSIREVRVSDLVAAMDRFADPESPGFPLFNGFEKFTAANITRSVKKNQTFPDHSFFYICDRLDAIGKRLKDEMENRLLFLKSAYFKFANTQLAERKASSNILFYNDLLLDVNDALANEAVRGDSRLIEAVRRKYKAALVDEFQDTDTVQYEIFTRIFQAPQGLLFMIGDPKQSIYSFRGADIFSYIAASARAESRHTLFKNWRSDPGLIKAVNTIFSGIKSPFLFDEITFKKSTAGDDTCADGAVSKPSLNLWFLPSAGNKPMNKSDAVQIIAKAIGNEISHLITSHSNTVHPGEIAVLVRTNRQARIVKESLDDRRIPSVLYGAGNIFDTREAAEIERILAGIIEFGNEPRFRSALATDIIGVRGEEIDTVDDNPRQWEDRRARFTEYFSEWNRHGFIRMFRLLLAREGVRSRLLAYDDGDRRLTNILHIGEILHRESTGNPTGMTDLLKWLSDQRDPLTPRLEEHQLRLESDASAVRIVTIHKSKGLEYPVVFCPFGWESSLISKGRHIVFHEKGTGRKSVLDLGSDHFNRHVILAQREILAENLRLLYVAVTRAQKRCYLAWGRINTAETSALAYLFHASNLSVEDDIVSATKKHVSTLKNEGFIADLAKVVSRSEGAIELSILSPGDDTPALSLTKEKEVLTCREFSGKIDRSWRVSSYSSLVAHQQPSTDLPDHDIHLHTKKTSPSSLPVNGDSPDSSIFEEKADRRSIFTFPKGARSGIFFHDVFENYDFTNQDPDYSNQLLRSKLREYGYDPAWKSVIHVALDNVLSVPLPAGDNVLTLSSITPSQRINEMEFYFPVKPFATAGLRSIFKGYTGAGIPYSFPLRLGNLTFAPSRGFLKGYIDLVFEHQGRFYILDWKSNHLGNRAEDYDRENINQIMDAEYYILQYCLYTVAFNRYVRTRKPDYRYEKDFGGVFYIFIRGINAEYGPRYGIYHDIPDARLIKELDRALIA